MEDVYAMNQFVTKFLKVSYDLKPHSLTSNVRVTSKLKSIRRCHSKTYHTDILEKGKLIKMGTRLKERQHISAQGNLRSIFYTPK